MPRKQEARSRGISTSLSVSQLHLDEDNPRLPVGVQGKPEDAILEALYNSFELDELADSMVKHGYFDEEPMVAVPRPVTRNLERKLGDWKAELDTLAHSPDAQFTVVEGNRRLATIRILLSAPERERLGIKHWQEPSSGVAATMRSVPVIVYARRADVVPYLGVRHIVGIRKWESYAKARYVAFLVDRGATLASVEEAIGDTQRSRIRLNYLAYKLLQVLREERDVDTKPGEKDFSLLVLALGQGSIKRFLGLPRKFTDLNFRSPVTGKKRVANLDKLYSWIYGSRGTKPVIHESRDITTFLSSVVDNPSAVRHLEATGQLEEAYERSEGDSVLLSKYVQRANRNMELAVGIIPHVNLTSEQLTAIERCRKNADELQRATRRN
jgi:hypothetical protein